MMVGAMRRYAITYKTNEPSFNVFTRKHRHDLRLHVHEQNFEGSKVLEVVKSNLILVSNLDEVLLFHNLTFKACGRIYITLLESKTRERNEIIGMTLSRCELWLAIVTGKNLIKN